MKKVHTLLIIISILSFCSCQTKKEQSTDPYNVELVESKKITLPIEDKKDFLSRSIFQFEEDGKEFLSFEYSRRAYNTNSSYSTWKRKMYTNGFHLSMKHFLPLEELNP